MPSAVRLPLLAVFAILAALALRAVAGPGEPPRGPFGLSLLSTADGHRADADRFYPSEDCGLCHERQLEHLTGSMHSIAHHDTLYRAFAELARKEAGEEVYAYCSGCHSAVAVVSGLLPGKTDAEMPDVAKAGVTCDVCHVVTAETGFTGPWGEPGNASLTLSPGRTKYGNIDRIVRNPAHEGVRLDFYSRSEYCASCHTVIHPTNGLRIEHTYAEWKQSVYAEKGIQCQDCHMRSVEDAVRVAQNLEPVPVTGPVLRKGPERDLNPHFFVGGNANADLLGGGERHAQMAVARLKSAAELAIEAGGPASAGAETTFEVVIRNVAAGHNLPTSLTELREVWVAVAVRDATGRLLYENGMLDEHGEIPPHTFRLGAALQDAAGDLTYRPWEGVSFKWKRLVPPKGEERERMTFAVPEEAAGPLAIEARLLYRSAPPHVVNEVMGDAAVVLRVVEMATARAELPLE